MISARRAQAPWLAAALFFAFLVTFFPKVASAYPWMIRHEYTACTQCHADPSGGGLLTQYGEAQGQLLLATPWGRTADDELGAGGKVLYGLVTPPDALLVGGSLRMAEFVTHSGSAPASSRFLFMQGDLRAQVRVGPLRFAGSLGVLEGQGHLSAVTKGDDWNLVSREYWAGYDFGEDTQVLLRVGRMNLPYGLRNNEHTMWIRQETRTDINESQQLGLAVAVNSEHIRAEGMFIAGNYQLAPDEYRERGYSLYAEYAATPNLAIGVSSLMTYARKDLYAKVPLLRQAHGLFARYSPWRPLVLMAQGDVLLNTPEAAGTSVGVTSMLQADYEAIQGLHFVVAGELLQRAQPAAGMGAGGWGSVVWFFLPKLDVRVDGILRDTQASAGGRNGSQTLLVQLHAYL